MYKVSIQDAIFHLKIGLYEEEQFIPNELCFNVTIGQQLALADIHYLDYGTLYACVKESMEYDEQTLEGVLKRLHHAIEIQFPALDYIYIHIQKMNPPIVGNLKSAAISWEYHNQ